jgi:hypothetical protein
MNRAPHRSTLALTPSLVLLAACAGGGREAAPPPVGSSPPTPIASATVTGTPAGAGACDLRWGFHGTVAGQEVFLRLERKGNTLAGRYLYAKTGGDLPLAGTLDGAGRLDLVEGDRAKPTGRFAGTCAGGVLDGTWSGAGKTQPFHLEAVTARPTPLVATRRLVVTQKPKKVGDFGIKECKYEQAIAEIYGAGKPEAELAINQQPIDAVPFLVDRRAYDDVRTCETGYEWSHELHVTATFRGLLTTEGGGTAYLEGSAHPSNAEGFHRETWVLATGHKVTEADVFSSFPEAVMKRCATAYVNALVSSPDAWMVETLVQQRSIDLTPAGVHVWSSAYPHVAGVLIGEGPVLTWGALLKSGALRADSPARSAWEGIAPAGPSDPECVDDKGKRL